MLTLLYFGDIIPVSTNRKINMSTLLVRTKFPKLTKMLDEDLLKLKDEISGLIRSSKDSSTPEHIGGNFLANYQLIEKEIEKRVEELEKKYESFSDEQIKKLRDETNKDWKTNYIELRALKFSPGFF